MKTTTRQEQAENLLIQMDAVQAEIGQTNDYRLGPSCVRQLEGLKSDIEALGFQVKRVPTGWALVEPVEEVAQVASQPTVELHEDSEGLYASVPSSNGRTSYTVRVCARWLRTCGCNCKPGQFGKDCPHQVKIDEQLRDIRPTFSEWIAGQGASRETIATLLAAEEPTGMAA